MAATKRPRIWTGGCSPEKKPQWPLPPTRDNGRAASWSPVRRRLRPSPSVLVNGQVAVRSPEEDGCHHALPWGDSRGHRPPALVEERAALRSMLLYCAPSLAMRQTQPPWRTLFELNIN